MNKRITIVSLITALAFAIRIPFFTDRSLWFDEAFSWRLIQFPFTEFLERAAADVHPILYYIVLWAWVNMLSFFGGVDSLAVLRLLSIIISALSVPAMYLMARTLFQSQWTGIVAAALMAVNAFHLQHAWEARMFALGVLLLLFATTALFRATTTRKPRAAWGWGISYGIITGLLLHVHYYTVFSVIALGLFVVGYAVQRISRRGLHALFQPNIISPITGTILAGIMFLPWFPVFLSQFTQVQQNYWIPPMEAWAIPNTLAKLYVGAPLGVTRTLAVSATIVTIVVVGASLLRRNGRGDWLAITGFLIPLIGASLLSIYVSVYQDRYFVFAGTMLVLLVARVLSFLPYRTIFALLAILVTFSGVGYTWIRLDLPSHTGVRGAIEYVAEQALADDPVVVSSPFIYYPAAFHAGCGLPHENCRVGIKPLLYSTTGEFLHFAGGPIFTPQDVANHEVISRAPRVWVIDTTGFDAYPLEMPEKFRLEHEEKFSEPFLYQGIVIVRKYVQNRNNKDF